MKLGLTILLIAVCFSVFSQVTSVTVSGVLKDNKSSQVIPFVNVVLKSEKDSAFVSGTVSAEDGRFTLTNIPPGNYLLEISYVGYTRIEQALRIGKLSQCLDLKIIELEE